MGDNEMIYRSVYIDAETWQRIERQARKESRAVNNLIAVLLRDAIATRELQLPLPLEIPATAPA